MENSDYFDSRAFFEKLFEDAPLGIVVQHIDGRIIRANRTFCTMFGYAREEVEGRDLDEMVARDLNLQDEAKSVTAQVTSGAEFSFESVRQRRDGSKIPVMCMGIPITVKERIAAVYGLYHDISDRKHAEAELKASQTRYRAIVQQQQDLIVRFTPDLLITFVNEAYCRFYGETEESLLGVSFTHHLPGGCRTQLNEHLEALTPDHPSSVVEEETVLPSGEKRWQQWADTAIFDEKGEVLEYQSVGRDITPRKKAEESLREANIRLQNQVEETVRVLAGTVKIRDLYTANHQEMVSELARAIGREMGMSEEQVQCLYLTGLIHDIGKLNVPAEILSKPSKLSEMEMRMIRAHPEVGAETVKEISFPWPVADIIRQHHERMDGSGYPNGLMGDSILPEARVLAVADVLEAMCSHRPHRTALGLRAALDEITTGRGSLYDPAATDAALRVIQKGTVEL